jgi:alpha-tubulin suppressor-like RCC1 family protein
MMRRLVICVTLLSVLSAAVNASADIKRWGAYGSNTFDLQQSPTVEPVPAGHGSIVKVDGGNSATYALSSDGTLWAFGTNGRGQLGDGTKEKSATPIPVSFPAGIKIAAVGQGRAVAFAVDSTGQAWAWGRAPEESEEGEEGYAQSLCLGPQTRDVLKPQRVPGLNEARAVQGAATHVLWLMDNGTVKTCGANSLGQLGIGSETPSASTTPVLVPGLTNVVEVSAGQATSCALTAGGQVYVWGGDEHGQVGNGEERKTGVFSPYHVHLPGPASEISCGGNYLSNGSTLALVEGVVYGWGDDEEGQVGDGQRANKTSPSLASETTLLGLTQVVTAGEYSLGVNVAGEVYGWGSNEKFGLATSKKHRMYMEPQLIDTGASEVSATAFNSVER